MFQLTSVTWSYFSGPDDDVFVYFADHGAPGLIAFPSSEVGNHMTINICLKIAAFATYQWI